MTDPTDPPPPLETPAGMDAPHFATPWEARVFAMTVHLVNENHFPWDDFKEGLIQNIRQCDGIEDADDHSRGAPYFHAWLKAAEQVFSTLGFCTRAELEDRINALAAPHAPGKTSPTGSAPEPISEA